MFCEENAYGNVLCKMLAILYPSEFLKSGFDLLKVNVSRNTYLSDRLYKPRSNSLNNGPISCQKSVKYVLACLDACDTR